MGKRQRIVVRACIFLLLGAIINVAAAWGCVVGAGKVKTDSVAIPNPKCLDGPVDRTWLSVDRRITFGFIEQDGGFDFKPVEVNLAAQTVQREPTMFCGVGGRPPNETLPMASAPWTMLGVTKYRGKEMYIASEVAAGWPALSFWGIVSGYGDQPIPTHLSALAIGPQQKDRILGHSRPAKCLPFYPLWPGFALNTVFYAAIAWAMFAFPATIRFRRRINRGLCPQCAYPVGTSPTCTECGAAVKPTS